MNIREKEKRCWRNRKGRRAIKV